jgi:TRAP-type uncharacterized transport system substrate-binding protein
MLNGGQWWLSIKWAAEALTNAGLPIDVTRYGHSGREPLMRVAEGTSDIGIALATGAAQAAKARGDYKNGEATSIRGLAKMVRPNSHYFNLVRADVGIRSFADIAERKPKLDLSAGPSGYATIVLDHYGVDLQNDIPAWGGGIQHSHPRTVVNAVAGTCNMIMWQDTIHGPSGIVSKIQPWVMLPLDEDIAKQLEYEYCAPIVTIPAGTITGQTEPCLSVTNPGFEFVIHKDLPDETAYVIAKALNESTTRRYASQDVFYTIRDAPLTSAPLHPGAERYYRDQGVLT